LLIKITSSGQQKLGFVLLLQILYTYDWHTNILSKQLTNSMEQSPSCKGKRSSASWEILHLLWNLKVHYHVHKSLLVPMLSHMNPVHTSTFYFCMIHFNSNFHVWLGLHDQQICTGLAKPHVVCLLSRKVYKCWSERILSKWKMAVLLRF
jgi:hypothetical protein